MPPAWCPPRPSLRKGFLPHAPWPTSRAWQEAWLTLGFKLTLSLVPVEGLHSGRGCQCPTSPKDHQGSLMVSAGPPSWHLTFEVIELSGLPWKGRAKPREGGVGSCLHFPNMLRSSSQNTSKAANPSLFHAKNAHMPRPELTPDAGRAQVPLSSQDHSPCFLGGGLPACPLSCSLSPAFSAPRCLRLLLQGGENSTAHLSIDKAPKLRVTLRGCPLTLPGMDMMSWL